MRSDIRTSLGPKAGPKDQEGSVEWLPDSTQVYHQWLRPLPDELWDSVDSAILWLVFCRLQLCSAIHKDPQRPGDTLMINFTITTILHECRAGWNPCLYTQAITLQSVWHLGVTRHPVKAAENICLQMFCSWTSLFSPCIKHTLCVARAVHKDFLLSVTITEEHFVCEWAHLFRRLTIPPKTYHKMFLVGLHMVFVISLCYYLTPYMCNSKLFFPPTTRHQV